MCKFFTVVGMRFRGCTVEDVKAPFEFLIEPENKMDPNAVKVMCDGKHVGYIAKDENKAFAKFMSTDDQYVVEVTGSGEASVQLKIYAVEEEEEVPEE